MAAEVVAAAVPWTIRFRPVVSASFSLMRRLWLVLRNANFRYPEEAEAASASAFARWSWALVARLPLAHYLTPLCAGTQTSYFPTRWCRRSEVDGVGRWHR